MTRLKLYKTLVWLMRGDFNRISCIIYYVRRIEALGNEPALLQPLIAACKTGRDELIYEECHNLRRVGGLWASFQDSF